MHSSNSGGGSIDNDGGMNSSRPSTDNPALAGVDPIVADPRLVSFAVSFPYRAGFGLSEIPKTNGTDGKKNRPIPKMSELWGTSWSKYSPLPAT